MTDWAVETERIISGNSQGPWLSRRLRKAIATALQRAYDQGMKEGWVAGFNGKPFNTLANARRVQTIKSA